MERWNLLKFQFHDRMRKSYHHPLLHRTTSHYSSLKRDSGRSAVVVDAVTLGAATVATAAVIGHHKEGPQPKMNHWIEMVPCEAEVLEVSEVWALGRLRNLHKSGQKTEVRLYPLA